MADLAPFSPLSELLGTPIADIEGTVIGHVAEFLVDRGSGRIAYVQIRIAADGKGSAQRLVVPWSSLRTARHTVAGGDWQLPVGRSALDSLVRSSRI